MDILYLLIPLSAVLVLIIVGIFGWAVHRGQFEDLDREGERILQAEADPVDRDQSLSQGQPEQSPNRQPDHSRTLEGGVDVK